MYINVTIKMSKQPLKNVVSMLIKDKDITSYQLLLKHRGTQRQFLENICSDDNLRCRIFGTFLVKFLACLPLLGFSNILHMV